MLRQRTHFYIINGLKIREYEVYWLTDFPLMFIDCKITSFPYTCVKIILLPLLHSIALLF